MYVNKCEVVNNPERKIVKVHMVMNTSNSLRVSHAVNTLRNVSQILNGVYLCKTKETRWYMFPTMDHVERFMDVVDILYPDFEMTIDTEE